MDPVLCTSRMRFLGHIERGTGWITETVSKSRLGRREQAKENMG